MNELPKKRVRQSERKKKYAKDGKINRENIQILTRRKKQKEKKIKQKNREIEIK